VDGGFLLVLCGFFFCGAFVRWADDSRCNYTERATLAYLFITIYAGYQIYLLSGSFMPAIAYLALVVPVFRRVENGVYPSLIFKYLFVK
jgi:hypothetical protein